MPQELDETRATAHLPGVDVEIVHRRAEDASAEMITISLRAAPSFEAFGRYLEAANPLIAWARFMELAWQPWLGAFLPPQGGTKR
ncbi:MAG TPA: hypothetical protein VL993_18325 [Stellaceae bacterium]|nr:hypothetical protein [Stellaceae bacterium]